MANILRICFWIGERFETTLLVQSFVMIAAQLYLLRVWHDVASANRDRARFAELPVQPNPSAFWLGFSFGQYGPYQLRSSAERSSEMIE